MNGLDANGDHKEQRGEPNAEDLLKLADVLNAHLEPRSGRNERSGRDQFATPSEAAQMMAGLLEPAGETLKVVDPGAGAGALMQALYRMRQLRSCRVVR